MRVQRILAMAGIASRRKCEDLIRTGRVQVNNKIVKLGDSADPEKDKIIVDGKELVIGKKIYVLLNKPRGFVTTVSESHGMKTVLDIVKVNEKVFPVGRLDKNTEGLLLLTNDGDFAFKLTHPKFEVEKEYVVTLDNFLSDSVVNKIKKGVLIDNRPVQVSKINVKEKEVVLVIHEGRKRIVRRLFEKLGFKVVKLVRTRVGKLSLGNLKQGKWCFLTEKEIESLNQITHVSS
ncbi:pseudouridine synthase [Candidatus Woesearchaeota archaeon CG10_big_fil_rev_8_21_14_0_10_37_12]|nr:MAG: pseudouridine synthase [Candidatus Woesearchaeota archaeon CG10_big_fil_rev_8_21_14_0_10_37_12]